MIKWLVLLTLLITVLFQPSYYSDNTMGNYDVFAQDGTLLTTDGGDDIVLFSAMNGVFYVNGDEIRFVDGVTANDNLIFDFGGLLWLLKSYVKLLDF